MKNFVCVNCGCGIGLLGNDYPKMVGINAKKDPDVAHMALQIVCSTCAKILEEYGVSVFKSHKCSQDGCEAPTTLALCEEHHAAQKAERERQALEESVTAARLEFVTAFGLKMPTGVMAKIVADANAAEDHKDLPAALRFWRQALSENNKWQTHNQTKVDPHAAEKARRRAIELQRQALADRTLASVTTATDGSVVCLATVASTPAPVAQQGGNGGRGFRGDHQTRAAKARRHEGKQRGANRGQGTKISPRDAMAKKVLVAIA